MVRNLLLAVLSAFGTSASVAEPQKPKPVIMPSAEETAIAHDPIPTTEKIVIFLVVCLLLSSLIDHLGRNMKKFWRVPYSAALFVGGFCAGLIAFSFDSEKSNIHTVMVGIRDMSDIDPHVIIWIFLPPLLYESASALSWHVLHKVLSSAVLLALPGVLINIGLTAALIELIMLGTEIFVGWDESFLLASILSATDPVAVVAALQSLGAPEKLSSLIEGESLLNDGSAIVFFHVFRDIAAKRAPAAEKTCISPTVPCILQSFIWLSLGGVVVGFLVGAVVLKWMDLVRSRRSPRLEVGIVLVNVYVTFSVAETLHMSGVLAVVAFGFCSAWKIGPHMSPPGRHLHHDLFAQLGYVCNQCIFFIAGIVSYRFILYKPKAMLPVCTWWRLLCVYIAIHVTRSLVVLCFMPALKRWGYGITGKESTVLIWGGLRGAVGLAMGLLVEHNVYIDDQTKQLVAFYTSGIVMMTLLINGTSVDYLYQKLDPYPVNPFRMAHIRKVLSRLEDECEAVIQDVAEDWFFKDVQWGSVLQCVPNFRNITFNVAGNPLFSTEESVHSTLRALADQANRTYTAKIMRSSSFKQDFAVRWRRRRNRKPTLKQWISAEGSTDASAIQQISSPRECTAPGEQGQVDTVDQFINISNTGDRQLQYRFTPIASNSYAPGIYVSARSMQEIGEDGFEVEMGRVNTKLTCQVVVGLYVDEGVARTVEAKATSILGSEPNSMGYDCSSGTFRWNLLGEDIGEEHRLGVVREGYKIRLHIAVTDEGSCVVQFITSSADQVVAELPLKSVTPSQLFPVVEFRFLEEAPKALLRRSNAAFFTNDNLPTIADKLGKQKSLAPRMLSLSCCGRMATPKDEDDCSAILSFEPQTASTEESRNVMFQVLFNAVVQQYMRMRDHRNLSTGSYLWLKDAVDYALDCANSETGAKSAADMDHVRAEAVARRGWLWKRVLQMPSLRGKKFSFDKLPFEPILLEYLFVERFCARASFWDRFRWLHLRQFGYENMKKKVEMLWAFIEAHEKILLELSHTASQDLVQCIRCLVQQAKADMDFLNDAEPRRFLYIKHVLAMRLIFTMRLGKMANLVNQGWVLASDVEALKDALEDRLANLEQYLPTIQNHGIGDGISRDAEVRHSRRSLTLPGLLGRTTLGMENDETTK